MTHLHSRGVIWIELVLSLAIITQGFFSYQTIMTNIHRFMQQLHQSQSQWSKRQDLVMRCTAQSTHAPNTYEHTIPLSKTLSWHRHNHTGSPPITVLVYTPHHGD